MSEDKKKTTKQPKTLHVDTLHIHANEIVLHREQPETATGSQQQMQIPRDFWGFPIRPMPNPQGSEENAEAGAATESNENDGAQQGPPQGPPPGWI